MDADADFRQPSDEDDSDNLLYEEDEEDGALSLYREQRLAELKAEYVSIASSSSSQLSQSQKS